MMVLHEAMLDVLRHMQPTSATMFITVQIG